MNLAERITMDPEICHGKPCIRGLRYPVIRASSLKKFFLFPPPMLISHALALIKIQSRFPSI